MAVSKKRKEQLDSQINTSALFGGAHQFDHPVWLQHQAEQKKREDANVKKYGHRFPWPKPKGVK